MQKARPLDHAKGHTDSVPNNDCNDDDDDDDDDVDDDDAAVFFIFVGTHGITKC